MADVMLSDTAAFVADLAEKTPIDTTVSVELNYIVAGLSMFSFALTAAILFAYSKGDHMFLGIPGTMGILFFSSLVTMQATLSKGQENFYVIYCLVVNVVIGILLNIYGSIKFFQIPTENERPLPFKQSSISVIMLGITIPLCLLELFQVIFSAKHNDWCGSIFTLVTLVQKIIQVGIYHFSLRHKDPDRNRHHGASFYLKIMALFNFFMWLQSIVDGNVSMRESLKTVLSDSASVVAAVYAALVIDYRLLCALLFIEFALEIDNWKKHEEGEKDEIAPTPQNVAPAQVWNTVNFRVLASQYTGAGYLLGISLFIAQFTCALQYIKTDPIGPWVNVFVILADVFVIALGLALLRLSHDAEEEENSLHKAGSKGVHIMVAFMGIVGLAFWIVTCSLTVIFAMRVSSYHPSTQQYRMWYKYLVWHSVTYVFKIIGVIFQLYFFFQITPSISLLRCIRRQKVSYMLVPCLMLAQISIFINSIIDSYSFIVEEFVHKAELNIVTSIMYKVGEPLHMGFCLHMFFHFFMININLRGARSSQEYVIGNDETDDGNSEASQLERLLDPDANYRTI